MTKRNEMILGGLITVSFLCVILSGLGLTGIILRLLYDVLFDGKAYPILFYTSSFVLVLLFGYVNYCFSTGCLEVWEKIKKETTQPKIEENANEAK